METAKVEKPIVMNSAVITPKVLDTINYIQTGGTRGWVPDKFDNGGFKTLAEYLDSVSHYVMSKAMEKGTDEDKSEEMKMLMAMFEVKETIRELTVPEGKLEM